MLFECGCCSGLWGHAWGLTITQQLHSGNGEAEKTISSRHCLPPPLTSCWNGFSTRTQKPLDCILKNNRIAASSPRSHFSPVIRWHGGMSLKVTSQQLFFSFSPSLYSLSLIRSCGTLSNPDKSNCPQTVLACWGVVLYHYIRESSWVGTGKCSLRAGKPPQKSCWRSLFTSTEEYGHEWKGVSTL